MTDRTETSSLREGLPRLLAYADLLRGQTASVLVIILLMLLATAVSLVIPLRAGDLVDTLAAGEPEARDRALGILGLLLVIQLLGGFFYSLLSRRLGLRTVTRLRRRLFRHLLRLPSLYFGGQKPGDLASRMTGDVNSIQGMLTQGLVSLARATLTLIGAGILMFRLNIQLTLVVLLVVPATMILVSFFGRRLRILSRRMFDLKGLLGDHVQEMVEAIRVIKVFNSEQHEQERFEERLQGYQSAGFKQAWLTAALESIAQILLWACLICVVIYGFYLTGQGVTSHGQLVSFMLLAFRVATPMGMLTSLFTQAQGAIAAVSRLDDVLRTTPELTADLAHDERLPQPPRTGALTLEHVGFRYGDDHRDGGGGGGSAPRSGVIEDLTLEIAAGEKVGVVGPSGAGKTTLACLLLGLFRPQTGVLKLDGRPYDDHQLPELRRRMAYVPQEPVLLDATVAENIRFGLTSASDEAVRRAAERAQALAFVEALPDRFATRLGTRGHRLSGGERQRLALARAFLHDPGVLILDEPTSALDAASEEAVLAAFRELLEGRTAIVVAHRLSLVRELDRILVLEKGRLVEQGSHAELLAAEGLYALLHRLQQGEGVSPPTPRS